MELNECRSSNQTATKHSSHFLQPRSYAACLPTDALPLEDGKCAYLIHVLRDTDPNYYHMHAYLIACRIERACTQGVENEADENAENQ